MDRMVLLLEPSAEQQTDLEALLASLHDPASPSYQKWLTPETFGERFGISDNDLAKVNAWLASHGFDLEPLDASRRYIVFSGTAGQVQAAFHTSIHTYDANGVARHANSSDPQIPAALASVIHGVVSLHDFALSPQSHAHAVAPQYTSGSSHYMAPADFATIYDASGLYDNSITGSGQSIAVIGRSNFSMADVTAFRSRFGLPANNPTVVLTGADPGIVSSGEQQEATLDVTWPGAVAKNAAIQFVLSGSTRSTDGTTLSSQYAVTHNIAPVISLSFGSCESSMGSSGNAFWNSLWQEAAAQGITVLVSAGDAGAAGCDSPSATTATQGAGVNGVCSSPYSTCVGGTQFADTANPTAYWSATTGPATGASALSYIPEAVWNTSGTAGGSGLWAGGGGASLYYTKPSWQSGPGVPGDGRRDVPDVSLNASTYDGYLVNVNNSLYVFGGTSASAPAMAGIAALLNQKLGARQGNINANLYSLATRRP
jgi:subtilase family serine protease